MRIARLCLIALFSLATAIAWTQQATTVPSKLAYEDGTIANHVYTNECFGISLSIPEGWQVQDVIGNMVKGHHTTENDVVLLSLRPQEKRRLLHLVLKAHLAIPSDKSPESFISDRIDFYKSSSVRDVSDSVGNGPSVVQYGDHLFVRADFRSTPKGKMDVLIQSFDAFVFTKFRGYFIGANLVAPTEQGLDKVAELLNGISFHGDEQNPRCEMRGDPPH